MVRRGITATRIFASCLIAWLLGLLLPTDFGGYGWMIMGGLFLLGMLSVRLRFLMLVFWSLAAYGLASSYFLWYVARITPILPLQQKEWQLTVLQLPQKFDDQAVYKGRTEEGWFVQFTLDRATPILPGTTVNVTGALRPYAEPDNPAKYWGGVRQKLFGKLSGPKVTKTEKAELVWYERFLVDARSWFTQIAQSLFVQPYAALFTGILAGQTADLAESVTDNFRVTGLSHLIAVSGFNVTILMTIVAKMTRKMSRWTDLGITGVIIFSFVIFTGASASVVRAGMLAGLMTLGRSLYRRAAIVHLLLVVAVIMTITNPLLLRFDIGFQLSFGAVLGLIFFADPIQQTLTRARCPPVVAELLAATTAAQITTVPITAYYFGTMSAYSVLANLFIGTTVSAVTVGGIPLILISALIPPIAPLLALPFDLVLRYIVMVATLFSALPYAQLLLAPIPLWLWVCYYLVIGGLRMLWRPTKQ
jgi:ComEC/Rec2-related protein